jgi:hypothetical protein
MLSQGPHEGNTAIILCLEVRKQRKNVRNQLNIPQVENVIEQMSDADFQALKPLIIQNLHWFLKTSGA